MKRRIYPFLLCLCFIVSCTKDTEPWEDVELEIPSYSITSEEAIPADEFLKMVENPLAAIIPYSFFEGELRSAIDDLQPKIQAFRDESVLINRVNFTYESTDKLGDPVTLSVHMCYPVAKSGKREVSSITLYSHIMSLDDSFIPTRFFCIDELRVFHNAAVVMPDFQGSGASYKSVANYASSLSDARQSIEALLVAKDIIARENHASLAEDFHTDNIGVSRGALVAFAIQKFMDDCTDKELAKAVNLRSSFAAEVNPFFFGRFEAMSVHGSFLNRTGWYHTLPSAYFLYPEYMEGLEFSDFFNDEFNSRRVTVQGKKMSMKDALNEQQWNLLEQIAAWGGLDEGHSYDILNSELCNPDGTFNKESRQWKALERVADIYDYFYQWTPKYPLTIGFHKNDYMLPFPEVRAMVDDLNSRAVQKVKLASCDFELDLLDNPLLIHAMAAIYWEFYTTRHAEV